jgi:hypothetical protein
MQCGRPNILFRLVLGNLRRAIECGLGFAGLGGSLLFATARIFGLLENQQMPTICCHWIAMHYSTHPMPVLWAAVPYHLCVPLPHYHFSDVVEVCSHRRSNQSMRF